LGGKFN